jgi:type VI secretion system protein ImpI
VRPASARAFEPPLASSSPGGSDAILRAIATGAGVSPDVFLQRPAGDVAAEIGMVLRTVIEELALLLKARAAAKVLAKSGNRTMISAVDNNPLKFVPRPEEVLEIMFAKQRAGYLDAKHSIDEAFRDLKTHEFATYAAMQKALSRLLEDLSPDAIEKKVSSSTFSSKKARSWEIFQATWEAKEKPHENGMLDVFLAYFSDAYAKASKPR